MKFNKPRKLRARKSSVRLGKALIKGRVARASGLKFRNPALVKAGGRMLKEANDELAGGPSLENQSAALEPSPEPRESPSLSSLEPSESAMPSLPSGEQESV